MQRESLVPLLEDASPLIALLCHYSLKEVHTLAHSFKVTFHIDHTYYQHNMHYHPELSTALGKNWCELNKLQMHRIKKRKGKVSAVDTISHAPEPVLHAIHSCIYASGHKKELHHLKGTKSYFKLFPVCFLCLLNLDLIGCFSRSLIKYKGAPGGMQAKGVEPHNPFGALPDTFALSGSAG